MSEASEVARHFGRNMQRARKRTGLSQEALSFRATLHRTEIGLLERGERVPRIDTLIKVAVALDVHIDCPLLDGIAWNAGRIQTVPGEFALSNPDEPGEG